MSQVALDIEYHVSGCSDDSHRMNLAANWIVQNVGLQRLSASIAIVDNATIHTLNREHLDHDWPTDVISFVFDDSDAAVDGEIIASMETALQLCEDAGWSVEDELLLYVIHGMLHLAGMNDIDDQDRARMRRMEQGCLTHLAVPGASAHLQRWNDVSY